MNVKCKHVMYIVCKLQLLPQLKGNPNYFLFTYEQQLENLAFQTTSLTPIFLIKSSPIMLWYKENLRRLIYIDFSKQNYLTSFGEFSKQNYIVYIISHPSNVLKKTHQIFIISASDSAHRNENNFQEPLGYYKIKDATRTSKDGYCSFWQYICYSC